MDNPEIPEEVKEYVRAEIVASLKRSVADAAEEACHLQEIGQQEDALYPIAEAQLKQHVIAILTGEYKVSEVKHDRALAVPPTSPTETTEREEQ